MPQALEAALTYAGRGWRVVPIGTGGEGKSPLVSDWTNVATTDPDKIHEWWSAHDDLGIGIVTGKASGIFVLDVDVSGGKTGGESIADYEAEHGPLPDTYEVITGSGGRHLYFNYPDFEVTNASNRLLDAHLDIRGEGGQVVTPPSLHRSRNRYERELGSPDEVADAPEWLLDLLRRALVAERVKPSAAIRFRPDGEMTPGDHFDASCDWRSLLEADGALFLRTDRNGVEMWARPLRDEDDPSYVRGTSATLYYEEGNSLKVFSSNWGGFDTVRGSQWEIPAETACTPYGYFTYRYFNGDFTKSASYLGQVMLSESLNSWVESAKGTTFNPDSHPMKVNAPLVTGRPAPKREPFPIEIFPDWYRNICEDLAHQLQVPVDLPGQVALGCISAVTNQSRVEARFETRVEATNLYLLSALPPGTGKSPVVAKLMAPVQKLAKEVENRTRETATKNSVELSLKEEHQKDLKHSVKKARQSGDASEEARLTQKLQVLAGEVELQKQGAVLKARRILVDDTTPEAFTQVLADNDGRIALVTAEGGFFDGLSRYVDSGKAANVDPALKAHSGDEIRVDRKSAEPLTITDPRAVLCVAVQPAILERVLGDDLFGGRGLTPRFMISKPDDGVGFRDFSNVEEISKEFLDAWSEGIEGVVAVIGDGLRVGDRKVLEFTAASRRLLRAWKAEKEPHLKENGKLRFARDAVPKTESSISRVAVILHLINGRRINEPISESTMADAILIGEYWLSHFLYVLHEATISTDETGAERVMRWIAEEGIERFTTRDLVRSSILRASHGARIADVTPVLEALVESGLVKADSERWREASKGSQSTTWSVLSNIETPPAPEPPPIPKPKPAVVEETPEPEPEPEPVKPKAKHRSGPSILGDS